MQYRDDAQRPPFDVEAAARRVAESKGGHDAYEDHANPDEGKFKDLGVKSRQDYARIISETMKAKDTECFHAGKDRTIFYRPSTNVFVAYDPSSSHGGTCYRPDGGEPQGRRQFNNAFKGDVDWTNGSPDRSRIVVGGYQALYPEQAKERSETSGQQRNPDDPPEPPKPGAAMAAPAQPQAVPDWKAKWASYVEDRKIPDPPLPSPDDTPTKPKGRSR